MDIAVLSLYSLYFNKSRPKQEKNATIIYHI